MERRMQTGKNRARRRLCGFTFVELMVVITIIVLLITMAMPIYNNTIRRAKESVLLNNLTALRDVIDHYTYDKQKAPQSLDELVTDGYFKEVPFDPMTGPAIRPGASSWKTPPRAWTNPTRVSSM